MSSHLLHSRPYIAANRPWRACRSAILTCRPSIMGDVRSGTETRRWHLSLGTAGGPPPRGLVDLKSGRGRRAPTPCQVSAPEAPARSRRSLGELDLLPILNKEGMIHPEVPEGSQAAVYAIFNEAKFLQFIGFSRDLRNSLRTVFSRRPDKAFFYKAVSLPDVDQQEMLSIRDAWFEELGGPPPGNKLALEREQWVNPASAFSINERGRQQAAEGLLAKLLDSMRLRGCREDWTADPEKLAEGLVDFLPAKQLTAEELDERAARLRTAKAATRVVPFTYDGEPADFSLHIKNKFVTNGGYMFDLTVTFEEKMTKHRVIVGKEYYADMSIEPEEALERVFAFLLAKKTVRQTEGLLPLDIFNINYFAVTEVVQWFPDFEQVAYAGQLKPERYWQFKRTKQYKTGLQRLPVSPMHGFGPKSVPETG